MWGTIGTIVLKVISSLFGQWLESRKRAALEKKAAEADKLRRHIESQKEAMNTEDKMKAVLDLGEKEDAITKIQDKLDKIRSFNDKYKRGSSGGG